MIIGIALVVDELHKGQRLVFRYPEAVPSSVLNSGEELLSYHKDYLSISPDNFARLFRPKAALFNKLLEIVIDDLHYISFPTPCSEELSNISDPSNSTNVITLFNIIVATVRDGALKRTTAAIVSNSLKKSGFDPLATAMGLMKDPKAPTPELIGRTMESLSRALLHQEKQHRYVSKEVALMLRILEEGATALPLMAPPSTCDPSVGLSSYSPASHSLPYSPINVPTNNTAAAASSAPMTPQAQPIASVFSAVTGGMGTDSTPSTLPDNSSPSSLAVAGNPAAMHGVNVGPVSGSTSSYPQSAASSTPQHVNNTAVSPQTSLNTSGAPAVVQPIDVMMAHSSLANELRAVYHGLTGGVAVNLTINNSISVSIPLYSSGVENIKKQVRDPEVCNVYENHSRSPICPHETLLVLGDTVLAYSTLAAMLGLSPLSISVSDMTLTESNIAMENIEDMDKTQQSVTEGRRVEMTAIPLEWNTRTQNEYDKIDVTDSNADDVLTLLRDQLSTRVAPALLDLIASADPTTPIADISCHLELSFEETAEMVYHLTVWGVGEVITTITGSSLYQIHPDVQCKVTARTSRRFANLFEGASLSTVLPCFDGRRTLIEAIRQMPHALQDFGVDIVIWLLRSHLLQQLHTVLLLLPNGEKPECELQLNEGEYEDELSSRIHTYADGMTPLPEVAWKEGVSEELIMAAVRKSSRIVTSVVSSLPPRYLL